MEDITIQTYRFKFTNEVTNELTYFAKLHQFDDRKTFKEAWKEWIETPEISSMIKIEIDRLTSIGYDGDILDKMFKSARYYFRKKSLEKKEPKKRREYIGLSNDVLKKIDEHIHLQLKENVKIVIENGTKKSISNISPADAYDHFCENNKDIIVEEIKYLIESNSSDKNI